VTGDEVGTGVTISTTGGRSVGSGLLVVAMMVSLPLESIWQETISRRHEKTGKRIRVLDMAFYLLNQDGIP
jgi:hypothetical protein